MDERVRKLNDAGMRAGGAYILYWCRWNRRVEANYALLFAAGLANRMDLPVLFYEALPCTHPQDNSRLHTFALEGVAETAAAARKHGLGFAFWLQRRKEDTDPLASLAAKAAAVVTDDCPLPVPAFDTACYAVDSSCIVPAGAIGGRAYAAYSIRPKIHKLLARYFKPAPPLKVYRPFKLTVEAPHTEVEPELIPALVESCDIDHRVAPALGFRGGRKEARRRLDRFLRSRLRRYAREKNEPAARATSDLSPYLHFGYIGALEAALATREYAEEHKLMADEFLEELIVRRELAFNFVRYAARPDSLDELPGWARATLDAHRGDRRDPLYTREQFEAAATYDPLWNAAQKELLLRGKIHGYYRMYWGKKILEWSASPEEALQTMLYLHDRYALDGRDPNTYANILWCFGLHDRPWPERPVYGTVRSMSRAGMERKTGVAAYLRQIEHLERTGEELTTWTSLSQAPPG
jgi:deoxyribodipyrimidine photo-lyase